MYLYNKLMIGLMQDGHHSYPILSNTKLINSANSTDKLDFGVVVDVSHPQHIFWLSKSFFFLLKL